MKYASAIKKQIVFAVLACAITITLSNSSPAQGARAVELPEQCGRINVPEGNKLAYHVYATGVQVYVWDGEEWRFSGPMADLYADPGYQAKIGRHYGGPTWKSISGGLVIGKKKDECSPDPTSIPWLLLYTDEVDGAGMFSDTTFIQRVNTTGGKVPGYPGPYGGYWIGIPYTAEYYFYRADGAQPQQAE